MVLWIGPSYLVANMVIEFDSKKTKVTGGERGSGGAVSKALWAGAAEIHVISRTHGDVDSLKFECPNMNTIAFCLRCASIILCSFLPKNTAHLTVLSTML